MDNKINQERAYKTFYDIPLPKPNEIANGKDRNYLMQKTYSNRKDWESRCSRP